MASYTATTIAVTPSMSTTVECENTSGTNLMFGSTVLTYAKADGGDQITITTTIPLIRRQFDTGFQY